MWDWIWKVLGDILVFLWNWGLVAKGVRNVEKVYGRVECEVASSSGRYCWSTETKVVSTRRALRGSSLAKWFVQNACEFSSGLEAFSMSYSTTHCNCEYSISNVLNPWLIFQVIDLHYCFWWWGYVSVMLFFLRSEIVAVMIVCDDLKLSGFIYL